MCASVVQNKRKEQDQPNNLAVDNKPRPIMNWLTRVKNMRSAGLDTNNRSSIQILLRSQIILFNSRKKWGLLFALATISGLFCVPVGLDQILNNPSASLKGAILISKIGLLPISTLLIITGMYVFNDLIDADLDRMNGKTKRPIPSGNVSKRDALIFVITINLIGISIPLFTGNMIGILFTSIIALIGVLYSVPKISLKDKFVIKTCAIAIAMMCSLLVGSSIYLDEYFKIGINGLIYDDYHPPTQAQLLLLLFPIFSGLMLALMVFVTSPLNDLGDIRGDKDAGRRTIPIVIGKENTVRLSILIALGMAISSWVLYVATISTPPLEYNDINVYSSSTSILVLPLAVSLTCLLTVFHLINVLKKLDDQKYVRDSVTKKSMPLHILLQVSLVIGCSLI
jgi:geranylgeranylglycerol-phosphate geranylgeranyltransferase